MRHIAGIVLILGLLAVFTLPGMARPGAPLADDPTPYPLGPFANTTGTPRAVLPVMFQLPTPTPTKTPTPTRTPTATATLPAPQAMQGNLRREEPTKPSYATNIENVWHFFWIRNNNLTSVYYGVLGVNVFQSSSYNFFHTSWSGELAPNGALEIFGGGCYGPGGYPCAGSAQSAEQRDTVIVSQPGTYTMSLFICQSSFAKCTDPNGGGNWGSALSTVTFTAIHWTPSAPTGDPTPQPDELCQLILDNPGGAYLDCKQ